MNDQVAEFVAEARRYCALIENESAVRPARLRMSACSFCYGCISKYCGFRAPIYSILNCRNEFSTRNGKRCASGPPNEPSTTCIGKCSNRSLKISLDAIHGSISDDLADIWRDVKMGLLAFDSGKPKCIKDAVWHWRFSFGSHWGYHVAGAIRALTVLHAAEFY
jgi:hypothetical protein